MDKHEAKRRKAGGEAILEQLGDVPVAYGFACELPAVHGEPLHELDRVWYDRFEAVDREWFIVLNGMETGALIQSLGLNVPGGAAVIVCDETRLGTVTPLGVTWLTDPDTGDPLEDEGDVRYWDDQVIEALHTRLTEKGKELPDLQKIVSNQH